MYVFIKLKKITDLKLVLYYRPTSITYYIGAFTPLAALNRSNTKPFKPGFKTHRYEKATTRTRADEKSKQRTEESCKSLQ